VTTTDQIEEAVRNGDPLELASFYSVADADVTRALWLLSISLTTHPEQLRLNVARVWPETENADQAVSALEDWPFIQKEANGWRVTETVASKFAMNFRAREPETFVRAHELLAHQEAAREVQQDPDEAWFIRGRIAYYLAGVDPDRSADAFNATFAEPPTFSRIAARMWLTSLALHQEPLLQDHTRQLRFYRGFRAYVTGRRDEALADLETVLTVDAVDMMSATAKHLVGVLTRRQSIDRSISLFEESIALCRQLELVKGEVMASNSLAWAHVERARVTPRLTERELETAASVARTNADVAAHTGDESLALWCDYSSAAIDWLHLTSNRRDVGAEAIERIDEIVARLRGVRERALAYGDLDTAVRAGNDAAQAFADAEQFDSALYELDAVLDAVAHARHVLPAFTKLGQTAGSIKGQVGNRTIREHAERVLERIQEHLETSRRAEILWSQEEDHTLA
jgi:hypothetical protein